MRGRSAFLTSILALTLTLANSASPSQAQTRSAKTLDIYYIDVEGGQATLFVSPSGESLLVDTGFPGERDAGRIMEAVKAAGLTQIDHLLSTHYHVDHIGNVVPLAGMIPIKHFYDHGPTAEPDREQVPGFQKAYADVHAKAKHTVLKPGDKIPFAGVDWLVVISAMQPIKTPIKGAPGAGAPNPACATFEKKNTTADPENGYSVGSVITFGRFRTIDMGDLLWDREFDLMCPTNRIGTIDVYLTTHHGSNLSGSEVQVHPLRSRVAIVNNGIRKGGSVEAFKILETAPGLEDIWQLHWSAPAGVEHNAPGVFIANVEDNAALATILTAPPPQPRGGGRGTAPGAPVAPGAPGAQGAGAPIAPAVIAPGGQGQPPVAGAPTPPAAGRGGRGGGGAPPHVPAYWIKVSANQDGSFTVTNARNGFSKTYAARN
jgi:beta-lactamase superfamily II metal-dependent hydrolase